MPGLVIGRTTDHFNIEINPNSFIYSYNPEPASSDLAGIQDQLKYYPSCLSFTNSSPQFYYYDINYNNEKILFNNLSFRGKFLSNNNILHLTTANNASTGQLLATPLYWQLDYDSGWYTELPEPGSHTLLPDDDIVRIETEGWINQEGAVLDPLPQQGCFSRFAFNQDLGYLHRDQSTNRWTVVGTDGDLFFISVGEQIDELESIAINAPETTLYHVDQDDEDHPILYFYNATGISYNAQVDITNLSSNQDFHPYCFEVELFPDTCLQVIPVHVDTTQVQLTPISLPRYDTILPLSPTTIETSIAIEPKFELTLDDCYTGQSATDWLNLNPDSQPVEAVDITTSDISNQRTLLRNLPELIFEPTISDSVTIGYTYYGCQRDTSLPYAISAPPVYDFNPLDSVRCDQQNVTVAIDLIDTTSMQWLDNRSTTPSRNLTPGDYQFALINGACRDTATLTITEERECMTLARDPEELLPNAFSPNSDGTNDFFDFPAGSPWSFKTLSIFDRWGNAVVLNETEGWNGYLANSSADESSGVGVYVYLANIRNTNTGEERMVKGNVHVMR